MYDVRARHCNQYGHICDLTLLYLRLKNESSCKFATRFQRKNNIIAYVCKTQFIQLDIIKQTHDSSIANLIATFEYSKAH